MVDCLGIEGGTQIEPDRREGDEHSDDDDADQKPAAETPLVGLRGFVVLQHDSSLAATFIRVLDAACTTAKICGKNSSSTRVQACFDRMSALRHAGFAGKVQNVGRRPRGRIA
jgi:hypothetical protein